MKIIEKDNELTMRDFPFTNWAYGAILVLGASIFGGGLLISLRKSLFQTSDLIISALIVAILYFAYIKLSSPIITTHIKLAEQTIEVTNIKLGLIRKTQTFKFSQIQCFEMVGRKRDRAFVYCNSMLLKDGTYIDLESEGHATNSVSGISMRLNELLKTRKFKNR